MRKSLLLLSLLTLFACSTPAQNINKAKLDSLLNMLADNNKAIGSMAIAVDGKVIYQKATGLIALNGSTKTNADVKTKYRVGSISKMFTAVLVLQLVEEGKLTLTTLLAKFYPQIPNAGKITIGMMLRHRSGLHNFTDSLYMTYYTKPKTHQEMINIFAKQKIEFEPDAKAEYSNTNFVLLGFIAEKLTGKTYAELLKTRIVNNIGLPDTYYGKKADAKQDEAVSFKYINNWMPEPETDMSIPAGAGAIVSTPTDLTQFATALFNGKLISDSSLNIMKTMRDGYGSAMFGYSFGAKKGYGHEGGIDEFRSTLAYYPDDKLAIAYCANGGTYAANNIAIGALSIYFNVPYTFPVFTTIEVKSGDLDKYLGNYSSTQMPLKITITKNNATLMAQATGQNAFPLEARSKDTFGFDPAGIELIFDTTKSEMTLKQGGRVFLYTKEK